MHFIVSLRCIAIATMLCIPAYGETRAQASTIGVTWSIPEDEETALAQLLEMRRVGIGAVRTSVVRHRSLLIAADSLGIRFFQDIDVGFLPARQLVDSIDYARGILHSIIRESRSFRSARYVGLARLADTSDPEACRYFESLADEVEQSGAELTTYYTTLFFRSDRCAHTVDGVLLEMRDVGVSVLDSDARRSSRDTPAVLGFASLGTWVNLDPDNLGVLNSRSPEWQARYLEGVLATLSGGAWRRSGGYAFVHRWQDPIRLDDEFTDIVQRRYGLLTASGVPRPAFHVLTGFVSGQQTVFAFERGEPPGTRWMWMTIVGWGALALLGLIYATSPQMRHMIPRYFLSHGFYREAVSGGRDSLPGESIALLTCVSVGVGMLLATLAYEISLEPVFEVTRSWLDPEGRDFTGALLDQPWTLTAVLASLYALALVGWTSTMSIISRAGSGLLPAQVLMLVVWSQWPLLLLLLASPAIAASDPEVRLGASVTVTGVVIVVTLWSFMRTLVDFFSISRPSLIWFVIGIALHPVGAVTVGGVILLLMHYPDHVAYVVHLFNRSWL